MKANEKYKKWADQKRRAVEFNEGDLVYAVLTKDRFPVGTYNKLAARKIGPVRILEKINDNAYRLELPEDVHTAEVFNVKHLIPYFAEDTEVVNSGTNSFEPRESDAARHPELSLYNDDAHRDLQQLRSVTNLQRKWALLSPKPPWV